MNSISVQVMHSDFNHMLLLFIHYWFVTLTQTDREFLLSDWDIQGITVRVLHCFPVLTFKVQRPASGVA